MPKYQFLFLNQIQASHHHLKYTQILNVIDGSNWGKFGTFSEAYISEAVQKCQYSL